MGLCSGSVLRMRCLNMFKTEGLVEGVIEGVGTGEMTEGIEY